MKKERVQHSNEELRRKAEKILGRTNKEFSSESEYMKVIQELSVHQIELELQNEELKEARQSEKETKEKYIQLYDFAPTGYLTLNKEGKIMELNLAASKMLGRERSRLKNASFSYFLISDSRPIFRNFLLKIQENSFSQKCEVTLENQFDVHLTGTCNNDVVNLTALDITHLKKVEGEKSKLLKEVLESRKKIDLLLQNARIGSWEWNKKTGQIWIDDSLSEILGLVKGEKKLSLNEFEKLFRNEGNLESSFNDTLKKRTPFESVFRLRKDDSKVKYLNAKAFISYDTDKKPSGLTGVFIDITSTQESFEGTLIRLNTELSKSNNDLQNFAYIASHDLQEPLRMVTSFVQLLEMQYGQKLDERAHEYIDFAVKGAKRMYDLLNSLLAYSRISTKPNSLHFVDMNEIVKLVLDNMQILIREKQARIESGNLPKIRADSNQMMQLIQNLVDNGMKFSKTAPHIHISSALDGDFFIFKVKDSGIGIEKEYFERIFRIFQKLHSVQEYNGTGVGLAICKSIVERHGGRIWLESQPGNGTTFYFSIPANPQTSDE